MLPVRPGYREGRGSRARGPRRPGARAPCPAAPTGWAGDLEPVVGGGPEPGRHVRRRRGGGRDLRRGGWGGERADEALESGRFGHEQEARLLGADDERVRDVARAEHERAGIRRDRPAVDPDRELALEDVEPLVLVVVDV